MRDYVLLSDSTSDLPADVIKELGIGIIAFSYSINDEVIEYRLDGTDGPIKEFYDRLRHGAMPVTSQVNPVKYKDFFKKYLDEGKDIFYLSFTSGMSGSYQTAMISIEELKEKYPDARIEVCDSLCASVGEGILLYQLALMKKNGADMDELKQYVMENRRKVRHWFMVEDLFHLKRGGRVSAVEAMVGSALKIRPILSVDAEGKLVVKSKARGNGKALEYLRDKVVLEGGDLSALKAVIGNADCMESANRLKNMVLEAGMKEENIMISNIGPVIGTHVGAGMTAIAFVSPDVEAV